MATAKPQATKGSDEEDLSMEEILQSIRAIIAEDEVEGAPAPAETVAAPNGSAKETAKEPAKEAAKEADVLELTELLKEDGTVVSLKEDASPAAAAAKPEAKPAAEPPAADVLSRIDQALAPAPEKPAAAAAAAPAPATPAEASELLSAETATTAAASFNKLKTIEEAQPPVATSPSPTFVSGNSVENMVAQMLKPMMKEWMDANLPAIVERVVEREVKRLTK